MSCSQAKSLINFKINFLEKIKSDVRLIFGRCPSIKNGESSGCLGQKVFFLVIENGGSCSKS